jgi:hypothetical protein
MSLQKSWRGDFRNVSGEVVDVLDSCEGVKVTVIEKTELNSPLSCAG